MHASTFKAFLPIRAPVCGKNFEEVGRWRGGPHLYQGIGLHYSPGSLIAFTSRNARVSEIMLSSPATRSHSRELSLWTEHQHPGWTPRDQKESRDGLSFYQHQH